MIREATTKDARATADIYNYYIRETVVTFEEEEVTAEDMFGRIENVQKSGFSWLVAVEQGKVVGYAYSSKWNDRAAYRHSAEVSVYLDPNHLKKGWGSKLYSQLFKQLQEKQIHTVIGGITLPNVGSVALHEKFGMTQVAHFKEVGFKQNSWLDVGYWQVALMKGVELH